MGVADNSSNAGGKGAENRQETEIRYEPVPGYRPIFFIVLTLAGSYLAYLFKIASHG